MSRGVPDAPPDRRWWEGAVLYQVYVRSWRDTNGDGYGDLAGVTAGLEYLRWLGVDGVWLSPTMPSPDHDWGYDVSDYFGVHPGLGTMEDLDALLAEARRLDLRVLLDLVPNHTSSEHPWFVEARRGRDSPTRAYYVWADPGPSGGPPNNWLDATGSPAWTFDERSGQYYLHNFLPSQPDLNWWHPEVASAFEDILRFWFGRGVSGFRIDVANGLFKDAQLRDNPPGSDGEGGKFGLLPVYNKNRPEVHELYRSWRKLADGYDPPTALLGETWVLDVRQLLQFFGHDDELHLAFNFPFLFSEFTAPALASVVEETVKGLPSGACPTWTGSNHDVSRLTTRWCGGDERKIRLALMVLLTLPGTVVLYYGDEIGMLDVEVPPARRRDEMTAGGRAPFHRDRARTPMQWAPGPGAGFCPAGTEPWLPIGPAAGCNVADQRDDLSSLLTLCRRLLGLRRRYLRGGIAAYRTLALTAGHWVYGAGDLSVAVNLSDDPVIVQRDPSVLLLTTDGPPPATGDERPGDRPLPLGPWQGAVLGRHAPDA